MGKPRKGKRELALYVSEAVYEAVRAQAVLEKTGLSQYASERFEKWWVGAATRAHKVTSLPDKVTSLPKAVAPSWVPAPIEEVASPFDEVSEKKAELHELQKALEECPDDERKVKRAQQVIGALKALGAWAPREFGMAR